MVALPAYASRLQQLLASLGAEHRVPGAVCGVLLDGETAVATWGVANTSTGADVTPDTLFQLGSLSKLYTTTLLLQAQGAEVVSLDEPVRAQLQEFSVADPGATIEITPRHLLTHTSGIEGDHLLDTGWNDDALQRYVASLAGLRQIHPPDDIYSVCNSGFGVAGRLLEVATGENFDRILRRRLARPLGCTATLTLLQHAILHRVAAGHAHAPGEVPTRQHRWTLARANGPMGGVLAPVSDVLAFARLHVDEGRSADGNDLLTPAAVMSMQEPQVESPLPGEEQALGWSVHRWGPYRCLAQDGDTMGQRALLRIVPERRFAVCVLANSPPGAALAHDLIQQVAADLLEVATWHTARSARPAPGVSRPTDDALLRWCGRYERLHQRVDVTLDAESGGLVAAIHPSGVLSALGIEAGTIGLRPIDAEAGIFVGPDPQTGMETALVFTGSAADKPQGLYLDGRLHRAAPA